jgi:quercetin dioxygenase-like cupin family protein
MGPVSSQQKSEAPGLRRPFERFDGTITLRTKDGQSTELHVVIRNWIIDSGQKIPRFPEAGFMIVQLRGGQLTTVIDSQRQERQEDEFWTVPAGSSLSIETGNDSALLQTLAVRDE